MVPTAAVLARAQATYRGRFRGAYAPPRSGAMPLCRPSTAKSSASRTDLYDTTDSLTVRGFECPYVLVLRRNNSPNTKRTALTFIGLAAKDLQENIHSTSRKPVYSLSATFSLGDQQE